MSNDFHLLLDTATTAAALREHLVASHGLELHAGGELLDSAVTVTLKRAAQRDLTLAEPTLERATIHVKLAPRTRGKDPGQVMLRIHRLAVAIMRRCPGDAALTAHDAATSVLRLGATVYVDPEQILEPRYLSVAEFSPSHVVEGIPDGP